MAKTMRKTNLKIQILAGNTLMSRFHVGFEIELPLATYFNLQTERYNLSPLNLVSIVRVLSEKNEVYDRE